MSRRPPPSRPIPERLSLFEHWYIRIGMSVLTILGFTAFLAHEFGRLVPPEVWDWLKSPLR